MTRSAGLLNRFLVSSDYSAYYRILKDLRSDNAPTSDYTLFTSVSGKIEYTLAMIRGHIDPQRVLVVEPNKSLKLAAAKVQLLQLTVSSAILIQHAMSMNLVPPKSMVAFPSEPLKHDPKLASLLHGIQAELVTTKPGREIVMRALVEQVLVQLLRQHSIVRRSDELEISRVGLLDRRIRRSIELMHHQLDQDLSLKDLAAASYLSPFHFARLFKKITGVTPHNYLAAIRAQKAQLLLSDHSLSINTVATRVGYLSSSHFTKAFRSATGTTPREFRKALINR